MEFMENVMAGSTLLSMLEGEVYSLMQYVVEWCVWWRWWWEMGYQIGVLRSHVALAICCKLKIKEVIDFRGFCFTKLLWFAIKIE